MTIPPAYQGKYFFHFTHIENLAEIAKNGLLSPNLKKHKGVSHLNVANHEIQVRRATMQIDVGPKGVVHDYVPFYFCARTPMFLSVLKTKNYDQPLFVHIAVSIEKLSLPKFVFSDGSANRYTAPNFFEDPNQLDRLSWTEIQSKSWKVDEDKKHLKMTEALCHNHLDVTEIDYIVVWNEDIKKEVEAIFKTAGVKCPRLVFDGESNYHHYYTWFGLDGEKGQTMFTGPKELSSVLEQEFLDISATRQQIQQHTCKHPTLQTILDQIEDDFSNVEEISNIVGLKTSNTRHIEDVDKHTRSVVEKLQELPSYNELGERQKLLVKFCAYMHDVGKGPSSRWKDGVQKPDDTHSKRSVKSVSNLMKNDIFDLTEDEVYTILILVGYHDLIGDSITRHRDVENIKDHKLTVEIVDLLYLLNLADVIALNVKPKNDEWETIKAKIKGFIK